MFQQRPDEEAVVDQGGTSTILNIHYEKEELEGKHCCSVYRGKSARGSLVWEEQLCHQETWVGVLTLLH